MKSGDKIVFGKEYCEKTGSIHLLNKTITLTPQLFEEDNGLYTYMSECPGIYDSEGEEAESIYHLFGNNLENIYDCLVIPASTEDTAEFQREEN